MLLNFHRLFLCNYFLIVFLIYSNNFIFLTVQQNSALLTESNDDQNLLSTTPSNYEEYSASDKNKSLSENEFDDEQDYPDPSTDQDAPDPVENDQNNENDTSSESTVNTQRVILNSAIAKKFKSWIDVKSRQLYALNANYSGFKLLNETYNTHLLKDATFAWIDFTKMIVNISKTISQVLYDKTQVVKNLSVLVEKAFNEYANNSDRVVQSTTHPYYDAKSPKTFCDLAQMYNQSRNPDKSQLHKSTTDKTRTSTSTVSQTQAQKGNKRSNDDQFRTKSIHNPLEIQFNLKSSPISASSDLTIENYDLQNEFSNSENGYYEETDKMHDKRSVMLSGANENGVNEDETLEISLKTQDTTKSSTSSSMKITQKKFKGNASQAKLTKKTTARKVQTTTATTTTTTEFSITNSDDDYDNEDEDWDESDLEIDYGDSFAKTYWDIECINRTIDDNFKSVKYINNKKSNVQVPVNVYKQDIAINMTAYWTEELDKEFSKNYENDNELFWQYFCSTQGLFRRYPAAHWSVNKNDFFDCRLQTWYITAAASPKDVIILLDTSGSMTGLRLEIGKKLIEFILDTFTDNDFFNILTFSNNVQFLYNESPYNETFIQAGKANKLKFKEKLESFKNTSQQSRLTKPLEKVFSLFNDPKLVRTNCNKVIMIITDGHADDVDPVFEKYNHEKRIRVFSFKIGRDMTDPSEIKKLACDNNGEYYHVVTLTDINEHVYEYIPVLSRPMALTGYRETTWSNVFIGYLDKELKIAVARPAFRDVSFNYSEYEILKYKNLSLGFKIEDFERKVEKKKDYYNYYFATEEEKNLIYSAEREIRNQQVLLGVVGVDVPVLRLISKVSPKFQMGVGIYIIMLDNNGFIVFHPSIKKEIATSQLDFKGTSHSVDLDKFEIPIHNDDQFEELEHEMIDGKTSNMTLFNWKREGLRVVKRRTEYVYTPVEKTPFRVAIASPDSFGRFYIEIPSEKESDYEEKLKEINRTLEQMSNKIETNIQLYNCSYSYQRLYDRITNYTKVTPNSKQVSDYCIRYLSQDREQVLAIKSDLVLHHIYYNLFNYSQFSTYPNLVKSSFYGTYSGITFYLPVTLYRPINSSTTTASTLEDNASSNSSDNSEKRFEAYNSSLNLFTTEGDKHSYSFEKPYYTRSIEFSDYLRTEFKSYDPFVIYFLNETAKDGIGEPTVSAAMPLWLEKVPAAVTGVVYNSPKFEHLLFNDKCDENNETCFDYCQRKPGLNVTCYLVDQHGIVVVTNGGSIGHLAVGQPLYKINPWLMMRLEIDGIFDLIIPGNKSQDCNKPPDTLSGSSRIVNMISLFFKSLIYVTYELFFMVAELLAQTPTQTTNINQNEIRIKNSHCYYFGIYLFNFTKWKQLDESEIRYWCNSTDENDRFERNYLAGYLKRSNLIMLVVEDEYYLNKCENITTIIKKRPSSWNSIKPPKTLTTQNNNSLYFYETTKIRKDYSINRYRKNPDYCHNYFPNESQIFFCKSSSLSKTYSFGILYNYLIKYKFLAIIIYILLSMNFKI